MKKLLNFLIVLFGTITLISAALFFTFYRPSEVTRHLVLNKSSNSVKEIPEKLPENREVIPPLEEEIPDSVLDRIEFLKSVIPTMFLNVKEGIVNHPALPYETESGERIRVRLLTFSPMEWEFSSLQFNGIGYGPPEKVYNCGGLYVLEYSFSSLLIPPVNKGNVEEYGVTVLPQEDSTFLYAPFSGYCKSDGFTFNLAGEFAGVCNKRVFIDLNTLNMIFPKSCTLIYEKGGKNGDIQG
ncbi:MAG: hypothetical protein ABGX12_00855 [Desulfurobacteriaceae bacterium]